MGTIEELERRINKLEKDLQEEKELTSATLSKANKAADYAQHAYRVDHYGIIWVWNTEQQKYCKTEMRIISPKVANRSIESRHIVDNAIEGRHLADNVIEGRMIKLKTIDGRSLKDDIIGPELIEDNSIHGDSYQAGALIPGKLADDAVQTRNIKDLNVTNEKIAAEAITPDKVAYGTIIKPVVSTITSGVFTLLPNRLHIITEPIATAVTFALGTPIEGVANEYLIQFTCGANAVVNFPSNIRWIDNEPLVAEPDMTYQVSIVNNLAVFASWEPTN